MKSNLKNCIFAFFAVLCIFSLSVCSNDGGDRTINTYPAVYILNNDWQPEGTPIPYTYTGGHYNAMIPKLGNYEFYDDEDYDSPFWGSYWSKDSDKHLMYVITSTEELNNIEEFYNLEEFNYLMSEAKDNLIMALRNLPSKYDESYFSENILILLCMFFDGIYYGIGYGGRLSNGIHSLTVNENTLTVNVLRTQSDGISKGPPFEIKVKKSDIAGVTNIEMVSKPITLPVDEIEILPREEYYDKKFTVDDFGREYFSRISGEYKNDDYGKHRSIWLMLKTGGRKSAKAAVEHLMTLDFIYLGFTFVKNGVKEFYKP